MAMVVITESERVACTAAVSLALPVRVVAHRPIQFRASAHVLFWLGLGLVAGSEDELAELI
jgi:hypothetical protein